MDEVTSQVDTYSEDLEDPAKNENFLQEGFLYLELLSVDISHRESFISRHIEQSGHRQTRKTKNKTEVLLF